MKKIVLVFPRGEAIRNFLYSGTAEMLMKDAEVTIISVVPNEDVKKDIIAGCDRFIELTKENEAYKVHLVREVLDLAHNRFIWTAASRLRYELRDRDAKSALQKLKRLGKKRAANYYATNKGLYKLDKIESNLAQNDPSTLKWERLFDEIKPDLVFNGSHIHNKISLPVVNAAKKRGIKTATFLFSWDNLTSQGRIMPMYDQFMVWNEAIKSDLLRMYPHLVETQVDVVGTPQFDFHFKKDWFISRAEFAKANGLDASKKWVLYTTGMPNHMPYEPEIVAQIADALNELPDKPQLILRVYPKDTTNRFEDLRVRRPDIHFQKVPWEPNWLTPLKDDLALFTNTLRHVDLGLNVASTVSLELAIFDKPIINIAYNPPSLAEETLRYADYYNFEHYQKVVKHGAIELVTKHEDLKKTLKNELENAARLRPERKLLVDNFFGDKLDGMCFERIAYLIKSINLN